MPLKPTAAFLVLGLSFALSASAQRTRNRESGATAPPTTEAAADHGPADKPDADHLSVTDGQVTAHGQVINYKATAGTLVLKDESGKAKASMFFVAYERQPASRDMTQRPITFLFNGGPGSSAVWLHLGAAGPKRVDIDDLGEKPAPPYHLVDNPDTWLGATDLVFIDPVGTGYSRAAPGEKPEQFYGVEQDLRSVAQFIRLYTTRYERWLSPKFLAGESYGTTRAAALSNFLLEDGISVNGIVLISCVLNFETLAFGKGNDLPYALYLPTYTALASYHKKLPADLQNDFSKAINESEQWSLHDYLTDLAAGNQLSQADREAAVRQFARLTGLSEHFIDRANLRVDPGEFRKELLADQHKIIGRYDGRLSGYDTYPLNTDAEYDPSYEPFLGAYSAVFNDYARRILKYESDVPYEVLSSRVRPWDFGPAGNGYLEVADRLRASLVESPNLRVMFCSGYFDLATPFLGTKYTINHMDVGPDIAKNVTHTFYEAGHMLYHHRSDHEKLTQNVETFIRGAISPTIVRKDENTRQSPGTQ